MAASDMPGIIGCQRAALRTPLVADPGERWEYGIGIDWAGLAVEAVTGKRLADVLVRDGILGPLGMRDTGFRIGPEQRGAARLHACPRRRTGPWRQSPSRCRRTPNSTWAAAGSTAPRRTTCAFCRMLLNGGTLDGARILAPETVAALGRNQIGRAEGRGR